MIGYDVTFKRFKSGFLDAPAVEDQISKDDRKRLMRFGGFTRVTARRSLRRRKRSSAADQPPSVHTSGEDNLKLILFAYDRASESVVIGPVKFASGNPDTITDQTIPELHEKGGEAVLVRRRGRRRVRRPVTYEPRPYMAPAFDKAKEELPDIWRRYS